MDAHNDCGVGRSHLADDQDEGGLRVEEGDDSPVQFFFSPPVFDEVEDRGGQVGYAKKPHVEWSHSLIIY